MKVKGRQCDLCHKWMKPHRVAYKIWAGNTGEMLSWEKMDVCTNCWGEIVRGMNRIQIDVEKGYRP